MKRIPLVVLVVGLSLALGLSAAVAKTKSSAGRMAAGNAGLCRGMGPGMMRGPMMGGWDGMMGAGMMGSRMMGRCGYGMMGSRTMGRCGYGMMGPCMMGRWDGDMMGRHMRTRDRMGMHDRLWHYIMNMNLDLSKKQKAEIWNIKTDLTKDMIKKKADLRIAKLDLHELLHTDKVDMKKVEAKVKEMEGLKSSMLLSGIEAAEKAKSILTTEQRAKLDDMMTAPGPCFMKGDDMTSGSMTDEDMPGEVMMEGAPQSSD